MTRAEQKARAEQMAAMWRKGATAEDIAGTVGVKRPAVYQALRRTGMLPPYGKRLGRRAVKMAAALPVIARDPCPRCGTRADYGCAHTLATGLAIAGHEADKSQRQGLAQQQGA